MSFGSDAFSSVLVVCCWLQYWAASAESNGLGIGTAECPLPLSMQWTAELDQLIYATPALVSTHGRGKQVVAAGLEGAVYLLNPDGSEAWAHVMPGSAASHATPVIINSRLDGKRETVLSLLSGALAHIWGDAYSTGLTADLREILELRVRKDWYSGARRAGDGYYGPETAYFKQLSPAAARAAAAAAGDAVAGASAIKPAEQGGEQGTEHGTKAEKVRRRLAAREEGKGNGDDLWPGAYVPMGGGGMNAMYGEELPSAEDTAPLYADDIFEYRGDYAYGDDMIAGYWEEHDGGGNGNGADGLPAGANEANYIPVDSHLLAAPAVATLHGEGTGPSLILPVSYFFDRRRYSEHPPGEGVSAEKYVASALISYDTISKGANWKKVLDISEDDATLRAYLYASPTVADLDGDGKLEVVAGTAAGRLHVQDAESGRVRSGFPLQTGGEIRAQVAVADVAGDAALEMIFGDVDGNILCISSEGKEIWRRQLTGEITSAVAIGDADGDGALDIAASVSGYLYLLRAVDGADLPGYPMLLSSSSLSASPLLVDLHAATAGAEPASAASFLPSSIPSLASAWRRRLAGSAPWGGSAKGLHVVVPSLDGHVYVVEAGSGCTSKIHTGAHTYAQILADDVTGNGFLDLVVSTMNGEVMVLDTGAPYHPLNAWGAERCGGRNVFTHGSHLGVFFLRRASSGRFHQPIVVIGEQVQLQFEIVDTSARNASLPGNDEQQRRYDVVVLSSVDSLGANRRGVLLRTSYSAPGIYDLAFKWPRPLTATVTVVCTTEHGLVVEDSVEVNYSTGFHATLKWMVVIPMVLAMGPLLLIHRQRSPLPV